MLRYLRYLVIAVFGLALLLVAVANRGPVVVRALPESMSALAGGDWAVQMPVFVLIFLGIAVGVLVGFLWEWLRNRSTGQGVDQGQGGLAPGTGTGGDEGFRRDPAAGRGAGASGSPQGRLRWARSGSRSAG
ncbi:MAG: hypothetical protein HZT43_13550 [Exiguobacterium profundum]|nr:MAG: hypothetical protein HZT43_13550 [Exiguobacterium profundum]